ncbi:MAG: hypothetical protein GDA55_05385 [Cellvibrionales bacterium]|nr:hypothetical protein [Cellvibrionales bacterium]
MSEQDDALRVYRSIREYCETYNIPQENLLDILEDQKVLPMIRGKATEYIGAVVLRQALDSRDWSVDKLNLNPQQGAFDEDVSITYRRTGTRLKAETKNAVRGKFSMGTRTTPAPHFAVKCHRSRSHMGRKTNDRYLIDDFDLLLCNVSNSIFRGKALDRGLPFIDNQDAIDWLKQYYGVQTDAELRRCSYDDWRVCLPATIADEDGVIPRTPRVLMTEDPNWFELEHLKAKLRTLIKA